jgi:hypothetical protein
MMRCLSKGTNCRPGGARLRSGAAGIAGAGLPQRAGASSGRKARRFSLV